MVQGTIFVWYGYDTVCSVLDSMGWYGRPWSTSIDLLHIFAFKYLRDLSDVETISNGSFWASDIFQGFVK